MNRNQIKDHYKTFFDLHEFGFGEGDESIINWVVDLVKDEAKILIASDESRTLAHVRVYS